MVLHKDKLISVLDIREFIQEDITDESLLNIILVEYDKDNVEHCIGLLVSSLGNYLYGGRKIYSTYTKSFFRKWNFSRELS